MHRVTLITRVGCHLCEAARADLVRISADLGAPYDEIDVDSDPALTARYGDFVPVILVDGAEHGYYRVEEKRLREALAR